MREYPILIINFIWNQNLDYWFCMWNLQAYMGTNIFPRISLSFSCTLVSNVFLLREREKKNVIFSIENVKFLVFLCMFDYFFYLKKISTKFLISQFKEKKDCLVSLTRYNSSHIFWKIFIFVSTWKYNLYIARKKNLWWCYHAYRLVEMQDVRWKWWNISKFH